MAFCPALETAGWFGGICGSAGGQQDGLHGHGLFVGGLGKGRQAPVQDHHRLPLVQFAGFCRRPFCKARDLIVRLQPAHLAGRVFPGPLEVQGRMNASTSVPCRQPLQLLAATSPPLRSPQVNRLPCDN